MGPEEQVAEGYVRSRSTTYVHPGVICRSTTGTGTSARLALMHYEGRLNQGDKLETVSLRNTGFIGTFIDTHQEGAYQVVENTITGRSYVLAHSNIVINCDDPLVNCGELHHILSDRHHPRELNYRLKQHSPQPLYAPTPGPCRPRSSDPSGRFHPECVRSLT